MFRLQLSAVFRELTNLSTCALCSRYLVSFAYIGEANSCSRIQLRLFAVGVLCLFGHLQVYYCTYTIQPPDNEQIMLETCRGL